MEQVYLSCKIISENTTERHIQSKLFDGTIFEIKAPYWSVVPVTEENAWLLVQVIGRDGRNGKLSIKLPSPVLNLGHNINVSANNIASVQDVQLGKMGNPSPK